MRLTRVVLPALFALASACASSQANNTDNELRAVTPKAKNKPNPGAPATKAEHAALKRVDKMVIKRMRKR